MKLTSQIIILILTILTSMASAHAASPREELKQMVEQLQKTPTDNALREKIIKLAQVVKPAPAIPDKAIEYEGRAQFAFKSAKSEADFLAAAREYENAIAAAPWVPGYYSDLCTIYEKAGRFEDAKRHCESYLTGLTDSAQMTDVKRRIAGLKFGIEKANSPQARAERERDEFAVFLRQNEGAIFKRFWSRSGDLNLWDEVIIENGVVMMGTHNQTEEHLRYNPDSRGKKPTYSRLPVTGFTSSSEIRGTRGDLGVMKLTFLRDGKTFTREYDSDSYAKGPDNKYSQHSRTYTTEVFQRQ